MRLENIYEIVPLTRKRAANILDVSVRTIARMVNRGELGRITKGNRNYYYPIGATVDRWVPAHEAAELYNVSPSTLRRWARNGEVKRELNGSQTKYLINGDIYDRFKDKIYIISDGEYIKIGISSDPEERLKNLQTGNPRELELLTCFPGSKILEKELHNLFESCEGVGEWFKLKTGDIEIINKISRKIKEEIVDV